MPTDYFIDGSRMPGAVPELARAAWAVVLMHGSHTVGVVVAPVWAPKPQTSQAAEWRAANAACQGNLQ